jgi:hypothetical protein
MPSKGQMGESSTNFLQISVGELFSQKIRFIFVITVTITFFLNRYINASASHNNYVNCLAAWHSGHRVRPSEEPGIVPRQGVRFLGIYTLHCCCNNLM